MKTGLQLVMVEFKTTLSRLCLCIYWNTHISWLKNHMSNNSCTMTEATSHIRMQSMKTFSKVTFFSVKREMKQKRKAISVQKI